MINGVNGFTTPLEFAGLRSSGSISSNPFAGAEPKIVASAPREGFVSSTGKPVNATDLNAYYNQLAGMSASNQAQLSQNTALAQSFSANIDTLDDKVVNNQLQSLSRDDAKSLFTNINSNIDAAQGLLNQNQLILQDELRIVDEQIQIAQYLNRPTEEINQLEKKREQILEQQSQVDQQKLELEDRRRQINDEFQRQINLNLNTRLDISRSMSSLLDKMTAASTTLNQLNQSLIDAQFKFSNAQETVSSAESQISMLEVQMRNFEMNPLNARRPGPRPSNAQQGNSNNEMVNTPTTSREVVESQLTMQTSLRTEAEEAMSTAQEESSQFDSMLSEMQRQKWAAQFEYMDKQTEYYDNLYEGFVLLIRHRAELAQVDSDRNGNQKKQS